MDRMVRYLRDRYWHPICHRNELGDPRDYIKFDWLGEEVVVFNDNGSIVAFDNRCPHRGARIFPDKAGNQPFVCPYHGWSYASGRVKVANAESFGDCSLTDVALNQFKSEWCGNFLFVSKDPVFSLDEQLGKVGPILQDISGSIASRHDFDSYQFECDWRICLENALEPYHVAMVHGGSLGLLRLQAGHNELIGENSIWYSDLGNEQMAKKLVSLRRLFKLQSQYDGYMSIFMFPFSMISSTFGYSYSLQNFFPSDHSSKTYFNSRLLTATLRDGVDPSMLREFFDSTAQMNRKIFAEDHQICRRVPLDSWSPYPPRYYSTSEAKLLQFRRSCLHAINESRRA